MSAKTHTFTSSIAALPVVSTATREVVAASIHGAVLFRPNRRDYLNIALIVFAVIGVLLLVSPARTYVITDDWCYAQSVDALLKGAYRPNEYSMATALGHVAWGATIQLALGTGFTTLSIATIIMGTVGLILFYLLLRHLAIPATWAMLAVTVLGGSPMYIYISYSFMTDVTFVTYSVAALLCYVRAAQYAQIQQEALPSNTKRLALRIDTWLLVGSVFAALAYLTRQLGLFLPAVVLAYFWWTRSGLTWRRVFAMGILPALAAGAFTLWQQSYPLSIAAFVESGLRAQNFAHLDTFVLLRSEAIIVSLFLVGIMLLPLIRPRRKDIWALLLLAAVVAYQFPISLNLGTWLPKNMGNIMDHDGLLMQDFNSSSPLPEWFWTTAELISLGIISLFTYSGIRYFLKWFREVRLSLQSADSDTLVPEPAVISSNSFSLISKVGHRPNSLPFERIRHLLARRPGMDPAWLVYGFGIAVIFATVVLSYALMDRYWLPVFPAMLLLAIRYNTRHTSASPGVWRWLAALVLLAFAIVNQQDYIAKAQARWDGGQKLVQQGASVNQIFMGIEWAGWYLADAGADYFRSTDYTILMIYPPYNVTDPVYKVSEIPIEGYTQIGTMPYHSWLRGDGEILLLKRQAP